MNEFDQFVKHKLKQRYYIRYVDDFVFLSDDKQELINITPKVKDYLGKKIELEIHPHKMSLSTLASGVDYLGYINFPQHRILRIKTKKRALRLVNCENLSSYLGVCKHAQAYCLEQDLINRAGNCD